LYELTASYVAELDEMQNQLSDSVDVLRNRVEKIQQEYTKGIERCLMKCKHTERQHHSVNEKKVENAIAECRLRSALIAEKITVPAETK
jgi:F0F1-type ATP synthase membrane subunit b/b'